MNKLREKREELGLTIKEVAEKIGVHFTTVSEWELERIVPRPKRRNELSEVLGYPKQKLFPELYSKNNDKILKATHSGPLLIGDFKISCAVLEGGIRVLVERSMAIALGKKGGGSYWKSKRENKDEIHLPEYVSAQYLQPFMTHELEEKFMNPINYLNLKNRVTRGVEASILPDICDLWIRAKNAGALDKRAMKTADRAYLLMRGFAHVGIIALVDEATGYQEVRDKLALQKILEKYIAKELQPYIRTFPIEFYYEIYRLKGWERPRDYRWKPVVGHYTNNYIYARLAPGVLEELKKLNPKKQNGRRKGKLFQGLTPDYGHPKLIEHISNVMTLFRASNSWAGFNLLIDRALPKYEGNMQQLGLPFDYYD